MPPFRPKSRKNLEVFQAGCLQRLVAHAYENVPYYRKLFDDNWVGPGEIKSAADLQKIPFSTRETLQSQAPEDLVARGIDINSLVVSKTSGSSGKPLIVRRTWKEQMLLHAFLLRANRFSGLRVSDHVVGIGMARTKHIREKKTFGQVLRKLGILRNTQIDAALDPSDIINRLRELKPDVVTGYPSLLSHIAGLMTDLDRSIIRPRFLMAGAELMTVLDRNRISKGFNAPVLDFYSSFEFHNIAWECRDTGEMHTADDSVIVEILKDGRPVSPGEQGEVVVTALHSHAMPFIRYKLGDLVVRGSESCQCGAPYSTIREIEGRLGEYIELPDGRSIHASIIQKPLIQNPPEWLGHFQIIQERRDLIVVEVVASTETPSGAGPELRNLLSAVLGPAVEITIRFVPKVTTSDGAKHVVLRSNLQ